MTVECRSAAIDARSHGATGDGTSLDTAAIQRAIDACASMGGTVFLPPGRYLSGTLFLRSDVTLHISKGATLLGSTNLQDFPPIRPALRSYADNYSDKSLIYGENLERIGITGEGIIDGQGASYERKITPLDVRPMILRFVTCQGVSTTQLRQYWNYTQGHDSRVRERGGPGDVRQAEADVGHGPGLPQGHAPRCK